MKPFNTSKYIEKEVKEIRKRIKHFDKIYIEIGGHILKDHHASRVLLGYEKNTKIQILEKIKPKIGIVYCINCNHIKGEHTEYNSNLNFEKLVLKEINQLKKKFQIEGIVFNLFTKNKKILDFKKKVEETKNKVYCTYKIEKYPNDLKIILGKNGYKKQDHLKTNKKILVVVSPRSNSGKMSFCLSQIYQDRLNNIDSGYFKLETFPIWNLEKDNPINLAYEAATADVGDYNMIDPYHKKYYGINAVNYNRDIENFKILKKIIDHIVSKSNYMQKYNSPTDMGINYASNGIIDLKKIEKAAIKEIYKRKEKYIERYKQKKENKKTVNRIKQIIKKIN